MAENHAIILVSRRARIPGPERRRLVRFLQNGLKLTRRRSQVEGPSRESIAKFKRVLEDLKKEHDFDAPAFASIEDHTIQWALAEIDCFLEKRAKP